jgi:SAM-dependent methyltransferase
VDLAALNRRAWDRQAESGGPWSRPVGSEIIEHARNGRWAIRLTPNRNVPADWFPEITNLAVLCLAASGGQQAPVLAAAGARVTVLDNSSAQLALDRQVAEREGLYLQLDQGDMRDLSRYRKGSFDLIVHPVSNCFVDRVDIIWDECYRVLRPGGRLLAGFLNPALFIFDEAADREHGKLMVRHRLPYADLEVMSADEIERRVNRGDGMTFSHSLEAQIGGQLEAGFLLAGLYEDDWNDEATALNRYMPTSLATLAVRPETG